MNLFFERVYSIRLRRSGRSILSVEHVDFRFRSEVRLVHRTRSIFRYSGNPSIFGSVAHINSKVVRISSTLDSKLYILSILELTDSSVSIDFSNSSTRTRRLEPVGRTDRSGRTRRGSKPDFPNSARDAPHTHVVFSL